LRRVGLIVILLGALASLSDYPLRVPALSAVAAVAALWASMPPEVVSRARLGTGKRLPQAITPPEEK
jgi:hypothetical protein